jgi:hypothetical protein
LIGKTHIKPINTLMANPTLSAVTAPMKALEVHQCRARQREESELLGHLEVENDDIMYTLC